MPLTRASINAAQLPIPVFTLGKAFDEVQYSLISQDIRGLFYEFKIVLSPCYCLKAIWIARRFPKSMILPSLQGLLSNGSGNGAWTSATAIFIHVIGEEYF